MNSKVDCYFSKAKAWKQEIAELRETILGCDLNERLKWGCPCYTFEGKNIVLIHTFKAYCAVLFFKGALLKDRKNILIRQTENVQAARHMRFTNVNDILKQQKTLKAYIYEAVALEEAGAKVELKRTNEFKVVEEFQRRLDKMPALSKAFSALTPGRQRGYLLYFASAKQAKTKDARIEKYLRHIMDGKGLDD